MRNYYNDRTWADNATISRRYRDADGDIHKIEASPQGWIITFADNYVICHHHIDSDLVNFRKAFEVLSRNVPDLSIVAPKR